jgi:hypothetical protein
MDTHSPLTDNADPALPLRVALELDLGTETIGGRIEGPDGPLEFSGWLGLASALEQLLGSATLRRR